jgi:hypothetical protein
MADQQEKTVHELIVFADNFQIHLQNQSPETEYPENWNDSLLTRLFACGPRVVGVGTVRDVDCELTLEIYAAKMDKKLQETDPEMTDYDHAAQCNIEIPSGKLLISGCATAYEDMTIIELPPGQYGVRIFWSNLDKTDDLGFEGDDHYLIQLWTDTQFDELILKFWRQLALQLTSANN